MYTFGLQASIQETLRSIKRETVGKNVTAFADHHGNSKHVFPIRPCFEACLRGRLQRKQWHLFKRSHINPLFSDIVQSPMWEPGLGLSLEYKNVMQIFQNDANCSISFPQHAANTVYQDQCDPRIPYLSLNIMYQHWTLAWFTCL